MPSDNTPWQLIKQGSPTYGCSKCSLFLHKSCAELPATIKHHLHRHRLSLVAKSLSFDVSNYKICGVCHEFSPCFFYYTCSSCKFEMDIVCASLPKTIENVCHQHPLTLLRKPAIFACDACGVKPMRKSLSYLCMTCQFWVHTKCALLQSPVKFSCHDHVLALTNSVDQLDDSDCLFCGYKVSYEDCWFYYCADCSCAAHVECITFQTRQLFRAILDKRSEEQINDANEEEDLREEMKATMINHFSHDHSLTLCNKLKNPDEKCNGCIQSISNTNTNTNTNAPFYYCLECPHFCLHKTCAELPDHIRHPLHDIHSLTLLASSPSPGGIFPCNACNNICNGFVYMCETCGFKLDIQCSLIQNTLRHEAHQHELILNHSSYYTKRGCNACGTTRNIVRLECADCNFDLDLDCATSLPPTGKHGCHRHVLSLTYDTVEDDSDEYYCDACEEKRNPEHWTYRCAESSCDISAHLKCIRGQYPRIKFGGTYKLDDHPHVVCLVQKEEDEDSPCEQCGYPRVTIAFECAVCNLIIDDIKGLKYIKLFRCECWKLNPYQFQ